MPNTGKSTFFNALTGLAAKVSNFPFTTIDPNHGVVPIPDRRPEEVARISGAKTWVNSTLDVVDIAGLIKDSHQGAGLGNQFLDNLRQVDAIIQIVRAFKNPEVVHPLGQVNPLEDIEIINYELCLADLALVEKTLAKAKFKPEEKKILEHLAENLSRAMPIRLLKGVPFEETQEINSLGLLTKKPLFYVVNIADNPAEKTAYPGLNARASKEGVPILFIPVEFEAELNSFSAEEASQIRKESGFEKTVLEQIAATAYQFLGLITFITYSANESKSWVIKNGLTALETAGLIHSDMARGFIKAEVISFEELKTIGSIHEAQTHGKIRIEGKTYVIKEGDVVHFKFNVSGTV